MKNVSFRVLAPIAGVIIICAIAVYGILHPTRPSSTPAIAQCQQKGVNHLVTVQNDTLTPVHTTGKLCDTLTIKNLDATKRLMAFGAHEHHEPYDGVTEHILNQGESFTITLNQTGTFMFHDHAHDEVAGTFTVQ